jgi:cytoskeletal protein RodZ
MTDSFGTRLRRERERRKIALKSIAENTKIAIALLRGLECDDVSRWPSGIFRKSFIRSYALAIGLDPEPVVREFLELYPDPLQIVGPEPEDLAREASRRTTGTWLGGVRRWFRLLSEEFSTEAK